MDAKSVIPINALFDESGVRPNKSVSTPPHAALIVADVIFGVDTMTQNKFLVYGRDLLEEIVETGEYRDAKEVAVELDQETEDLERLLALVSVIKGKHDYQSGDEDWTNDN